MNPENGPRLNLASYSEEKKAGVVKIVKVHGNTLLARKAFDPLTGKPTGMTVPLDVEQLQQQRNELADLIKSLDELLRDAGNAKEMAD